MPNSQGIIYVATGTKYIEEAIQSAASVKRWMPNIPITLFTSEAIENPNFDQILLVSDPKSGFTDKVLHMYESPYDQTLFLDTDTFLCDDVSEIFSLLEHYDVAASQAELRVGIPIESIPESFPEMNTGVIAFKKSPLAKDFFEKWKYLYLIDRQKTESWYCPDQPSFRLALYGSPLRITTLPPEYNCRFIYPVYVDGKVKILHGRYDDRESVANEINSKLKMRCFFLELGSIGVEDKRPLTTLLMQKLKHKFRRILNR